MVELGLLRCPVCGKQCPYRLKTVEDRETAKELSTEHLKSHRLGESKRGLYRVQMANAIEATEVTDVSAVSLGTWGDTSEHASMADHA